MPYENAQPKSQGGPNDGKDHHGEQVGRCDCSSTVPQGLKHSNFRPLRHHQFAHGREDHNAGRDCEHDDKDPGELIPHINVLVEESITELFLTRKEIDDSVGFEGILNQILRLSLQVGIQPEGDLVDFAGLIQHFL